MLGLVANFLQSTTCCTSNHYSLYTVTPWEYQSSTDGSQSAIHAYHKLSKITRWASIRTTHSFGFYLDAFFVQIPEFDNFYLDMNGIIHACSHPNDDDPTFRISEDKIFNDIFRYIEVSFTCTCSLLLYILEGVLGALGLPSSSLAVMLHCVASQCRDNAH